MRFAWNSRKERINRQKHGVSFELAARDFLDPLHLTRQDRVVEGEQRWHTLGRVNDVLLLLVVHTVIDEGEETIRIISARKATRQERIEYEEADKI